MDPFSQLMMTVESPKIWDKGIPIIWDIFKRAHKPRSSALVLVLSPTPNANSKWCDTFRYRQIPTPPRFFDDTPSKKPQGKTKHGEGPITLIFLQETAGGLHSCKKESIWCIMFKIDNLFS